MKKENCNHKVCYLCGHLVNETINVPIFHAYYMYPSDYECNKELCRNCGEGCDVIINKEKYIFRKTDGLFSGVKIVVIKA